MNDRPQEGLCRRGFIGRLTLAGTASLFGFQARQVSAEPAPETKKIRLLKLPTLCQAPQYVAEELLQGEGFTDIRYVRINDFGEAESAAFTSGAADIAVVYALPLIPRIDAGDPIVFLSGVHVGCVEIFANDRVRTIRDLKGRTFAISAPRDHIYLFLAVMAAQVGLNIDRDINWVVHPVAEWPELLRKGTIDAFLGIPPVAQENRARKIGHVILNTLTDRPWSQYFCCMVAGNKDFVRRNPIATKRALRAILKASELCALQPEKVARFLVDKGHVERSDYAVQSMKELVYGKWREYDAADAVRFYSLRLHEAGVLKSTPQKILARGADWRFVNELKKELRG